MASARRTLLLVDDEIDNLAPMQILLGDEYDVLTAQNGHAALQLLARAPEVDVIIADQRMPGMTGVELLQRVRENYPQIIRLVLSGYSDFAAIVAAVNQGQVFRYISKPWDVDDMRLTLRQALEFKDLRAAHGHVMADLELAHRQLLQRNKQLEQAQAAMLNQEKLAAVGRLAAELAHEMNNQLQVVMNANDQLRELTGARPEEREIYAGLEESTQILADIAADIRDFSRGAKLQLRMASADLSGLAQRLFRTCQRHSAFRGHELHVKVAAGLFWRLDERQLRHVLLNLLKNAAKASPPGQPITLQMESTDGTLIIRVVDHGCGVPPGERERIFEPFVTQWADNDGTGLGLAICGQIVTSHGGRITCEETPGGGATFSVFLP